MKCIRKCGNDTRNETSNYCEDCWQEILFKLRANTERASRQSHVPPWLVFIVVLLAICSAVALVLTVTAQ